MVCKQEQYNMYNAIYGEFHYIACVNTNKDVMHVFIVKFMGLSLGLHEPTHVLHMYMFPTFFFTAG